ncbi:hypothetical protein [Falsiroseomonas ponticola]|jgi:hypothetical protein|uniref:hypothetical protein n=1 Tax=Falsiroseomonas ponticola TaxID=2786951 RepID=UPI0019327E39|nr:hypothetical protein [Roseomonas ponticola]
MQRRRLLLAALAGTLATLSRPADAALRMPPPEMTRPEEPLMDDMDATVEEAQYGPPPRRGRRRRRCWIEARRIPFRDRWGRLRYRIVEREVCR